MKLKVTLVKSISGAVPNHVKIVKSLGLRKLHQEKEFYDVPYVRGMLFKVKHLVQVEEIAE